MYSISDTNLFPWGFLIQNKNGQCLNHKTESSNENEKGIQVQIDKIPKIINNGIEQFISIKTRGFFEKFDLNGEFLKTEPLT